MAKTKRISNFLRINSVPPSILAITVAASWLGMITSIILKYPIAVVGLVTLIPWLPLFLSEALWKYRHYAWFALYEILLVTQGLHMIEHIAQIMQIYVLGVPRAEAHGIFGNLDVEYVHFFFDTSLEIGVILLLFKFPKNIPLWAAGVVGFWHTTEHWYITYYYTFDRANYLPTGPGRHAINGLLGHNGLLWPNSPFQRAELHFLYNLLFTIPLIWGFILMMREAYDEYLKKAFPRLTEAQLASLNTQIESVQVEAGEIIIRQGDPADKFYIISKGEVEVIQETGGGQPVVVNRLTTGQFFGEVGLLTGAPRNASVRAVTHCDLLALDRNTFRAVIGSSVPTAQDYAQVLAQRSGARIPVAVVGAPAIAGATPGSGTFPPGGGTGPAMPVPPVAAGPVGAGSPSFAPSEPVFPSPVSGPFEQPTAPTLAGSGPQIPPQPAPGMDANKTVNAPPPQFRPASTGWAYGLIFADGPQAGQGVVLSATRMQIGRDVSNEIRLADDSRVSRRHAELLRTPDGSYQIRDLGSSNGVFVNNERLAPSEARLLKEDDQVRIGNSTFVVRKVGARVV